MAPKAPPPCMQKFGAPLYAGAFLTDELLVLGGGGGKKSSGIANRLMVAKWADGVLAPEPVFTHNTGDEPPARIALHPDGSTLVCAFGDRLQLFAVRVVVATEDAAPACSLSPKELPVGAASLTGITDTKCISFSADGSRMVLGGGDGRLRLFTWPELALRADVEHAHPEAVSDADFSPDGSLLLTTGNERVGPTGGGAVWRVAENGLQRVCWLDGVPAPKGARVTLRGAKFARDGSGTAFTGANFRDESRVLAWRVPDWRCVASRRALTEPLTSLALSPGNGRLLAAGGSEGSIVMLASKTFAPMRRVPSAHMVFVTGLSFSPSGRTLASLSADASARCTLVPPKRSVMAALLRIVLAFVVHAAVVSLVLAAHRRGYWSVPAWLRAIRL